MYMDSLSKACADAPSRPLDGARKLLRYAICAGQMLNVDPGDQAKNMLEMILSPKTFPFERLGPHCSLPRPFVRLRRGIIETAKSLLQRNSYSSNPVAQP